MNLRLRLFLLVGSLFIAAFVLSYFLENYLTETYLRKGEKALNQDIIKMNEQRRQQMEEFVAELLLDIEANIAALLKRIQVHPAYKTLFESENSWQGISTLLMTNKWLDYVQRYSPEQKSEGVYVKRKFLDDAISIPLQEGCCLVYLNVGEEEKKEIAGPYVGIKIDVHEKGLNPHFWALFDLETILNFKKLPTAFNFSAKPLSFPPFYDEIAQRDYQKEFLNQIAAAKEILSSRPELFPRPPKTIPSSVLKQFASLFEKKNDGSYEDTLELIEDRYLEIEMIWNTALLFFTMPSLTEMLNIPLPVGMLSKELSSERGKSILNREIFFSTPYFDPKECASKSELCSKELSIINLPKKDRAFFVNALKLDDSSSPSLLALGVDTGDILKKLSLATHKYMAFISGKEIISVFSPDGNEVLSKEWLTLPVETIIGSPEGTIEIGGISYFYIHLYPTQGFHFFIFNPSSVEFALVEDLDKNANLIIKKISFHMRLASVCALAVVLIFLNRISRKITQPIARLANAAKSVEKGHYEAIDLPKLKKSHHDEVSLLYDSFGEMVTGLKEKEKVRGVLNKVVSSEIAEEILKGKVHLGGEEKTVTVFFADIRGFTKMTENMNPAEVIDLLNACMTKVSHIIDEYGGVIDKYVGDEVMALFGAPVEKPEQAFQAVSCALEVLKVLNEWKSERSAAEQRPIEMGIGIHTGNVVAGNMGAENRLNYTVLGANVNFAARLCSAAGPMEIYVSEMTLNDPSVKGKFRVERVEDISLKGFTKPFAVYRLFPS